jgi:hypothetical protein
MKPQQVFPGKDVDAREVVNLLVQVHPVESVGLDLPVSPPYIPVANTLLVLDYPAELLADLGDNRVLRITDIQHYFLILKLIR